MLVVVVGLLLTIVGSASAAIVRVRVEGKSSTIFGATQPLASATTALDALEAASIGRHRRSVARVCRLRTACE